MSIIDYYEILQVSPKAHQEVIRSAYRTMMSKLNIHPDKGGNEEEAKLLNEAYEVLSDENKRKYYDQKYYTTYNSKENNLYNVNNKSVRISENRVIWGHNKPVLITSIGNYNSIVASSHNSDSVESFKGGFMKEFLGGIFYNNQYDTAINIFNVSTGEEIRNIQIDAAIINNLTCHPYNNVLGFGTNEFVKIIDINTLEELFFLQANGGDFGGVEFNYDLSIMSIGVAGGAQVYDIRNGNLIANFTSRLCPDGLLLSNSGRYLASNNTNEDLIHIWDICNNKKMRSLPCIKESLGTVGFNNNDEILAVSNSHYITFWNILTGKQINEIHKPSLIVKYSNQNKYFAIGDMNGNITLFDSYSMTELHSFKAHSNIISSINFTTDDNKIISASLDRSIRVFDIN